MTIKANPIVYIFPAVIFGAAALYYLYGAIDQLGLESQTSTATVTEKTYTQGSTSYVNRVAGGRTWTQAQEQAGFYAISLTIKGEPTVALVSKEKFDHLRENEQVQVVTRRTRLSGRLEVTEVK